MDGEIELFFRLSEIWVKNNDNPYNPKNTVYVTSTLQSLPKLIPCIQFSCRDARAWQVAIQSCALALGNGSSGWAFLHFDSLETLKKWNPDNNEPIPLLWRPSVARKPVLRQVTRFGGLSNSAWTRVFLPLVSGSCCQRWMSRETKWPGEKKAVHYVYTL
jgi:hypothetical protein